MKPGIYLKPGSTLRGQAVRWNGIFSNWFFRLIYILSNLVGFAMLAIIIASFTKYQLNINISFAYFLLTIAVAFIVFKSFISGILEKEYLPLSEVAELAAKKPVNLFAAFSPSLAAATDSLFTWKKIENINLKSLATAITKDTDLNFLLNRLGLSEESLTDVLANHEDQSLAFPFLLEACQMAVNNQHKLIQGGDVLLALFEKDPPFVALLESLQINLDDIKNVVYWLNHIKGKIAEDKLFTTKLRLTGGVGRDWAFGYTPYLKNFSRDITQSIRDYGMGLELVGREKEILEIIEALSKQSGGNAIVVGDAGIGKHTVVMGFAKAVLEGKTSGYIAHKHVFQVDTDTLLAGASDPGELAARLSRIL
ncbi:MAG: hypothetical protein NTW50_04285, partial [Candidatus Berkelbacteria bacterium]|nr:hypothetical protein [Candidatus Berkelbacteria bacterium]